MDTRSRVTRLIPLHINKGKTNRPDAFRQDGIFQKREKTEGGKYLSSYGCDPRTADEEFLLSKRQYEHMIGRRQEHDIIAYQIRQSFKPGEVTPEEANRIGHELGMRFTKGKHALLLPLTPTGRISTTTSFSIPRHWTAPENSKTSSCPALPCNGSATGCVWNMVCPSSSQDPTGNGQNAPNTRSGSPTGTNCG